ncbi:MAG: hypothetical protein AB1649_22750 [Chloroflexota bacterium]
MPAKRAKEKEKYMKRVKQTNRNELRGEYKLSDFPGGFVRGKYASRLRKSSNIVVLMPEVAKVFPNEEAVNKALLSLIDVAQKTTRLTRRSTGRTKKMRAG